MRINAFYFHLYDEMFYQINNNLSPNLCKAQIAAKQRKQIPRPVECMHTNGKVSVRGGNEKTTEQFSNLLAA